MASYNYHDPDLEYKRRVMEGERQRKLTEADARNKQLQIQQDEATRNTLLAQRNALDQAHMMTANDANPRTVTGTSMTISSPSASAGTGAASRRLPTGGFGSSLPNIDGRYMSLIEAPKPELNEALPPQVQMPAPSFGMPDAKAHQDAAFARTKDRAGQLGQGALQSLASTLAGRGIGGQSGTFGRGLADIVSQSVQPLADLNVAHLGEEYTAAGRERGLAEQRAGLQYQGGISQRSQDMNSQQALNSLKTQLALAGYSGDLRQLELLYRLL